MKANTAALIFSAGIAVGIIAGDVITRKIEANEKKKTVKLKMSRTEWQLREELILWLAMAPGLGYTPEQIADHYNKQIAFIDLISNSV